MGSGSKNKKNNKNKSNARYILVVFWATFFISAFLSLVMKLMTSNLENAILPIILLVLVILLGIVFDIIGMSMTVASPAPFHAKASRRIKGADKALFLLNNADRVANICNDVIGDICGVISGSFGAAIAISLFVQHEFVAGILVSALVSALTVGGKAFGKRIAIKNADTIVWTVTKLIPLPQRVYSKKNK